MKPDEFRRRLPTLLQHYEQVAAVIDTPVLRAPRKVSHREVLDDWSVTRNMRQTARAFDISPNAVWLVVYKALQMAERCAAGQPLLLTRKDRATLRRERLRA